jgi:ribosomal protein S18 acetylase RimI-like enzyme
VIRGATVADADGIAAVEVRTFRHAYGDILDPRFLAELDPSARAEEWREALGSDDRVVFVAEIDARVVGYASVRDDGDLRTLYVDPVAQGAGLGTRLLAEAERAGARTLEVFEANGHGRRFYEARGWRDDGPSGAWLDRPLRRYVRWASSSP